MTSSPALTLIRRTIENNAATVDLVARGEVPRAFLTWRFGYVTGREAYSIPLGAPIRFRPTDMVGVEIRHRPKSPLGYRIISAYPRNYNERIGR